MLPTPGACVQQSREDLGEDNLEQQTHVMPSNCKGKLKYAPKYLNIQEHEDDADVE